MLVVSVLYAISLENYLLFRIITTLFNIIIAYMVFIIVWKSKVISENRYFTITGIALFFMACFGFLRALSYKEMGLFPGYGTNLPVQLWIAMRYVVSTSFFIAPLFLTPVREDRERKCLNNEKFALVVFFIYAIITALLLLSIFKYRNFPESYIEGSGLTDFKIYSEYIICGLFIGSLILLYRKRDRFERKVYRLLTAALIVSIFAEFSLIYYTNTQEFLNFIGLIFVALSFYLIYIAMVETAFEEPYSLLFRELKLREETLRKEADFLRDDQGKIYRMLGVEECIPENKSPIEQPHVHKLQSSSKLYSSFIQDTHGLIYFRLNEDRIPLSMEGAIKELTDYNRDDFISGKFKWVDIVIPEDRLLFIENMKSLKSEPNSSLELEYRIRKKYGEIRWVQEVIQYNPKKSGASEKFEGFIHDITQRKMAEETLSKNEEIRIKEIHHRIKNNLQVISSLLSLQADKLTNKAVLQAPEVLEAFRESQNRVVSMALIHEELYEGKDLETLDFSAYLRKLTSDLLKTYNLSNEDMDIKLELEQVNLGMDTSVPLGIIANELLSNAFKHAFPENKKGEICIRLSKLKGEKEDRVCYFEEINSFTTNRKDKNAIIDHKKDAWFILTISDNGKGIPENFDISDPDSLGLQLVNLLIEQIDGHIVLNRNSGTEFRIIFKNKEK